MVQTPKYLLVQDRIGRPLAGLLQYWRLHGVSNQAMARMLSTDTGVSVTGQTIGDWFDRIDRTPAA